MKFKYLFKLKKDLKKYLIYVFKDTKYFFTYLWLYFKKNNPYQCLFYKDEELINLIKNKRSIIRVGDGEIALIHYLSIHYQNYNKELREDLLDIIKNYNENSKYILSIPIFVNYTNSELKHFKSSDSILINRLSCWLPLKVTFQNIFNKNMKYFDAHAFYRDNKFDELIMSNIRNSKILLVTNKNNIEKIKKTEFSKNIFAYIDCPDENAYNYKNEIKKDIHEKISNSEYKKNDFVILMSAGLSKTIIFDLSNEGYQCLDIGKGLEGYYEQKSLEYLI